MLLRGLQKENQMNSINRLVFAFLGSASLLCATGALAEDDVGQITPEKLEKVFAKKRPYSPYAERSFPTRPLFGDTHLHTAVSFDAGVFGARLLPRDAYRLARGEQVNSNTGQPVKLSRPLDFLVVADHSDNMGMFPDLAAGKPNILADPQGRKWYNMMQNGEAVKAGLEVIASFSNGTFPKAMIYAPDTKAYKNTWLDTIAAAEEFNDPGRFTAFIGYEWTSQGAFNIHRNVIFRDGGDRASQVVPYVTMKPWGSPLEPDLWKWMMDYEAKTGGDVLAIPHNGNLSNGIMFGPTQAFSKLPLDKTYVEARAKWEPLYEATQTKGDGESHPYLSPNDEFAGYEKWDFGNLNASEAKRPEMLQYEYARSALKMGMQLEKQFGTNPYKFGMIGSTDAHTGLAAVEEDNFWGKVVPMEPNPDRIKNSFIQDKNTGITVNERQVASAGYAAVWATENTREAIFDAMERKETYGTTGTRMMVRFFGGFDYEATDANTRNPAVAGYAKGVPMGGDLGPAPAGKVPTFLVAALKDPLGANLDRYQIVKGWMDDKGETHEKVYDVVWSDDRKPGTDGKLPPVGNTVDVATATWSNTIGDPELIAVWKDPDFNPKDKAFYYGRVIEIPTPRWTTYDAKYFGEELPKDVPSSIQERAYTSPIWYNP
jgi:hypothetical protein